jgi:hypothetical protein
MYIGIVFYNKRCRGLYLNDLENIKDTSKANFPAPNLLRKAEVVVK